MKNMIKLIVGTILVAHFTACGTILYPERKGQISGRLDVGVVLLDAIGLLFFIIPGVICFAVDFSNGTIYLPGTRGKGGIGMNDLKRARFDRSAGVPGLEKTLSRELGRRIRLDRSDVQIFKLGSEEEMLARFTGQPSGLVLARR